MPLGFEVPPPAAYVAFCERKPLDCGADAAVVLAEARREDARIAYIRDLVWRVQHGVTEPAPSPAALRPPVSPPSPAGPSPAGTPPLAVGIEHVAPVRLVTQVAFVDPFQVQAAPAAPRMDPDLWATLNRVNDQVNRAMIQVSDWRTYGKDDYWNTPLEDGHRTGDCEDFALEKERALVAAGVPRAALDIAVVLTRWGEAHAVLLVATSDGEYVLDSLSPSVLPWRQAPYRWLSREVAGNPFHWMTVSPEANEPSQPHRGFLIAMLR